MADEQTSTLAFLQNFYTDVTLYMPFEAHERTLPLPAPTAAPAAVEVTAAAPPVSAAASVSVAVQPAKASAPPAPAAVAPPQPALVAPPIAPVAPAASKLPSLAAAGLAASPAEPAPAATPTPPVPAAATVPPYLLTTFSTLGSNAQGVVLLVRLPVEQFNKLPRNVFLNNLLKAINLVMADVVLVNVEGPYPVALQNLRKEIAATCILAFGKNLLDVAVRTTQIYEPVHFPNQEMNYLAGAEIEMVEYDTSLKKRLWAGLKAMFL